MSEKLKQGEDLLNLVVCYTCKTIEEAPYTKTGEYLGDGKYKQDDNPFLPPLIDWHGEQGHVGRIFDCDSFLWMSEKGRKETVEQIKQQLLGGSTGLNVFGTDFYNVKATFTSDAGNCYNLHMRPKGKCDDYKSDKKILKPQTEAERKELGLGKSNVKTYLCDFCVVKSFVQKKVYTEKGLYN
jgi:hypothetical protein